MTTLHMKRVLTGVLLGAWVLCVVLAYFVGQNVHARRVEEAVREQRAEFNRRIRDGRIPTGRMGPGDTDPRGN